MYHVSAQGVDERMINVHYYYYFCKSKGKSDRFRASQLNQHLTLVQGQGGLTSASKYEYKTEPQCLSYPKD